MELLENNAGYAQLFVNLYGHWDTAFEDLPDNLKSLAQNKFPRPWDKLDAKNRRNLAHQYDCLHDPNQEPATYFKVAQLHSHLNDRIKQTRKDSDYAVMAELQIVNERVEDILEDDRERVGAEIRALRAQSLTNAEQGHLPETERNTMLKIIFGMAVAAYNYDPNESRNKATGDNYGSIYADLSRIGLEISSDSVRKYVKEAEALYG